ncbi:MAG: phosphoribosylamine--glycine ligase [Proteobacteria bacterium]|nr:phosphoribosylamine--glycine ligase [Pseudomonadota bacterium]
MKILVIGGGGREHALAWKIAQSPDVSKIFVAPGNAGTAREPKVENIPVAAEDVAALVNFARDHTIDLTIIGPEAPLALGVVDAFTAAGLRCFGPTRAAAQLESSKAYAKDFLARHKIPTAAYRTFTDAAAAIAYVRAAATPIVIKADGLAAGKGVVIAQNEAEAITAITDMLSGNGMGDAGRRVVIEEFLRGEEASFIVMVDGAHSLPLATAQDHKARDDGDRGPNTGGMGAYSPAPVVTPEIHARIMREVIAPTVRGMAAEGTPYTGFLYAGLMIAPDGSLRVLEFNCRLGDPETQPILMRLRSDLAELCNAALDKRLQEMNAEWDPRAALGVVLAAGGYPGSYRSGDVIHGLEHTPPADSKVFHAGTRLGHLEGEVVTAGGRVLCACALGDTVGSAQRRAYELVQSIRWRDLYYRTDIGHRAIARETSI